MIVNSMAPKSPSSCRKLKRGTTTLYRHKHQHPPKNKHHGIYLTSKCYTVKNGRGQTAIDSFKLIAHSGHVSYVLARYNGGGRDKKDKGLLIVCKDGKFFSKRKIEYNGNKQLVRSKHAILMEDEMVVDGLSVCQIQILFTCLMITKHECN